jgi:hypothetical protein
MIEISEVYKKAKGMRERQEKEELTPEHKAEFAKWQEKKDFVPIYNRAGEYQKEWRNKKECIFNGSHWERSINYCMERLGPDKVKKILQQRLKIGENYFKKSEFARYPRSARHLDKYQEVLNDLIKMAKENSTL